MEIINEKDPHIWRIAQKRAAFKKSVFSYLVVNGFLWLIWLYSDQNYYSGVPWPIWPMLGWGLGIAFQYFDAYQGSKTDLTEREYDKIKDRKN